MFEPNNYKYIEEIIHKYHDLCLIEFTYSGVEDLEKMINFIKLTKEFEEMELFIIKIFKDFILDEQNSYHINYVNDNLIYIIGVICSIYFSSIKNEGKKDFIIKYIDNYIINFYRPTILFNYKIDIFFTEKINYKFILKFIENNFKYFSNKEYTKKFKSYLSSNNLSNN